MADPACFLSDRLNGEEGGAVAGLVRSVAAFAEGPGDRRAPERSLTDRLGVTGRTTVGTVGVGGLGGVLRGLTLSRSERLTGVVGRIAV